MYGWIGRAWWKLEFTVWGWVYDWKRKREQKIHG